jgi:hypothetical protein
VTPGERRELQNWEEMAGLLAEYQRKAEQQQAEIDELRELRGKTEAALQEQGALVDSLRKTLAQVRADGVTMRAAHSEEVASLRKALGEARQERLLWTQGAVKRQADERAAQISAQLAAAEEEKAQYKALYEALKQRSDEQLGQCCSERDAARKEAVGHREAVGALMRNLGGLRRLDTQVRRDRIGDFEEPPPRLLEHLVQVYAFSDEQALWWWSACGPSVVGSLYSYEGELAAAAGCGASDRHEVAGRCMGASALQALRAAALMPGAQALPQQPSQRWGGAMSAAPSPNWCGWTRYWRQRRLQCG